MDESSAKGVGSSLVVPYLSDDNTLSGAITDGENAINNTIAEGAIPDEGEKAHTSDPAALDWEDSPENPYNWTTGKKWAQVAMCASFAFAT